MKRIISVLLAVILLLQTTPVWTAPAYPEYNMFLETATSRLNELGAITAPQASGKYGLLYKLGILTEHAMYLEFLQNYGEELGASEAEIKQHKKVFEQQITVFNNKFGGDSDTYTPLKLSKTPKEVYNAAVEYLSDVYAEVSSNAAGTNEGAIKGSYGVLLGILYEITESLLDVTDDLNDITPYDGNKSKHKVYNPDVNGKLAAFERNYSLLYQIGQEASSSSGISEILSVDLNVENYAENLADVETIDGELEIPEEPNLSLVFNAIFAASSVYTPLQSYVGDSAFIAALKAIPAESEVADQLEIFYNHTKDYKKPLYYRKLDDVGTATGAAKQITIAEFFQMIKDGASGSLCTVGGEFGYDVTTDSWVYTQDKEDSNMMDEEDVDSVIQTTSPAGGSTSLGGAEVTPSTSISSTLSRQGIWGSIFSPEVLEAAATGSSVVNPSDAGSTGASDGIGGADSIEGGQAQPALTADDEKNKVEEELLKIPASATITDSDKLTDPVLMFGSKYLRTVDNLTMAVLTNILKDTMNQGDIGDIESRYLYLDAYGDIVTDNNLVILPGAANPLYFSNSEEGYNPFTVAFMNAYPVSMYVTENFQLVTQSDIGKYLLIQNEDEGVYYATVTTAIDMVEEKSPLRCGNIVTGFSANGGETPKTVLQPIRMIFGTESNWDKESPMYTYKPLVSTASLTVNNNNVFPYTVGEDSNFETAKIIASNFYNYLTYDEKSSANKNLGKLYDNYVLHYVVLAGLDGSVDAEGYSNAQKLRYTEFFKEATKRRINSLVEISSSMFNKLSEVDGVVGLRNSYQDEILGKLFTVIRTNWVVFLAVLIIILLFAFAKMKRDLFQSGLIFVSVLGVAYAFVIFIPVYIPMVFNMVINNISENLTYEVLGTKTEFFDSSDSSVVALDEDGKYKFNTTSLTLYRTSAHKLEEFEQSLNVDASELSGGNTVIVNQESGLFAEGDSLKINTDVLFDTLKIVPEIDESTGISQMSTYKTVSNNVDYYTPFYSIVDSFCEKMNSLAEIYYLPKQTATYVNGTSKTNYMVYSYVHSAPFLMPGDFENTLMFDMDGLSDEEKAAYESKNKAIAQQLDDVYGANQDWLGISSFLYNPDEKLKATLWMQTLKDNQFYDSNWEVNEDRMDVLIGYVNRISRRFVFAMEDQIGTLSDDVMIKLIAVRAMVALNQKASQLGHWLYPYSLNYEELSLGDVLNCVFTDDYYLYTQMDMDVVKYVESKFGWFNLVVFDVLVVVMYVVVNTIRFSVPVMYLLLGVLLIIKLVSGGDLKVPIKGYLRSTLIVMASATSLCLGVLICKRMDGNAAAIYVMLFLMLAIMWLLGRMVSAVASNIMDFGASVKLTDMLTNKVFNIFNPHKSVNVNSTIVNDRRGRGQGRYNRHRTTWDRRYDMDAPMGYMYSRPRRYRRSWDSGRYDYNYREEDERHTEGVSGQVDTLAGVGPTSEDFVDSLNGIDSNSQDYDILE